MKLGSIGLSPAVLPESTDGGHLAPFSNPCEGAIEMKSKMFVAAIAVLVMVGSANAANLLPNPSFEEGVFSNDPIKS